MDKELNTKTRESDIIYERLQNEENDIKALKHFGDLLRAQRMENFEETWLRIFEYKYPIEWDSKCGKYIIDTDEFGVLDYFPKCNKLLIRKENKWVKPALRWLIKNLLQKTLTCF